jgi:signal peptidase I
MRKPLKIIINVLPYIFFAVALLLIIQVVIALKNETAPSVFGYSVFSVETPSMEPEYMTGDLVFVKLSDPHTLSVGDVITFRRPDKPEILITHRIVEIQQTGETWFFTTLGDNNHGLINDWETDFSETFIIGEVTGKSTLLGKAYSGIVSGGINIIYGVAIGIFILIGVAEILNIVKEVKLSKNKELLDAKAALVEAELEKLRAAQASQSNEENK